MGTCHVCDPPEPVPDYEVLDHLRVFHPAEYGNGPQRWPDGTMVMVDSTLEPKDFDE